MVYDACMDILTTEAKPPRKIGMLGVRIELSLLRDFNRLAKERGLKASGAARLLIKNYVETMTTKRKSA